MATVLYHCSNCKQPIDRHEPVRIHREGVEQFYFHTSEDCFVQWLAGKKNDPFYKALEIEKAFSEEEI